MPKQADTYRDQTDAFLELSESLRTHATRPNLYGYAPHYKQVRFHSFGYLQPDGTWRPTSVASYVTGDTDRFIIQVREQLIKIRLYIGGNRSGKTVGGIIEDMWWVTKTHPFIDIGAIWPEPIRGRICAVDFTNGHEKLIIPEILRWCPRSYLLGGSWRTAYDRETRVISFEGGGTIELMSYDQDLDKFAGTSRHFIHFDEEPPEEIYKECMARTIDTGGCIWFTMTPVHGMDWSFDKLYEPGTTGDNNILVVEVDMFDNPFVSDEEKEVFISFLTEDEKKARIHGQYVRRGGLIYKEFDEKIHVIEPEIPSLEYLHVASVDHGFRNPTAWLWHAVNYEGRVITYYEHYASDLVISDHAKTVHEINKKIGRPPDYYVGDPSIKNKQPISGTSILEEYVRYHVPIMLGNNDVDAGIIRVARYLKSYPTEHGINIPFWVITSNCEKTIWEIKRYRWATWAHKRTELDHNVKEEPVKKDDHAMDSCRYFFMSQPELFAEGGEAPDLAKMKELAGVLGATNVHGDTSEVTARDWDNLNDLSEPNQGWTVEEYAYSQETHWQYDELMGGEW